MKNDLSITCAFDAVEQLDAASARLGWPLEYRQLEPGCFSSTFTFMEDESWFLLEEQTARRVEVATAPLDKMYVLALAEGDSAVINGQSFGEDHVMLVPPTSGLVATLPAGLKGTQLGIAAELFEEVLRAIAPDMRTPFGQVTLLRSPAGSVARARCDIRETLRAPATLAAMRDETISSILVDLLGGAFGQVGRCRDRQLHRAGARRALDRAREYIEANVGEGIRLASLSNYSGTSLRSLERIFARELGTSPQQYVLARRLNAVRRRLLAEKREQGVSVTQVAQDLGFSHLGRFAGDYRRYFGESPHQTLAH